MAFHVCSIAKRGRMSSSPNYKTLTKTKGPSKLNMMIKWGNCKITSTKELLTTVASSLPWRHSNRNWMWRRLSGCILRRKLTIWTQLGRWCWGLRISTWFWKNATLSKISTLKREFGKPKASTFSKIHEKWDSSRLSLSLNFLLKI